MIFDRLFRLARPIALALLLAPLAHSQDDAAHGGMLRDPDVSATHIVFVYANDLWIVGREGGTASPLAAPAGREASPRFSPDGAHIAFVGNYEGNADLYVIPSVGGVAERVTHHPSTEALCDWTPDGERLIFSTNGLEGQRAVTGLFHVARTGGMPERYPVPYGARGTLDATGQWLAYTPWERDGRTWKRYRGGMASDVWLFHLAEKRSRRVTDWEGTDSFPMWHGETLYYLSDRGPEHRLNVWRFDPRNGVHVQVTQHDTYDVKWPAIGPGPDGAGEIVYQHGSELRLLSLASGESRVVSVTIPGDRRTLRTRTVDAAQFITSWDVSPNAKRAVVEARGDLWTLPAEKGAPRALTLSAESAERSPAWSPDGRWIAYVSDATGEYELYVTQSDGRGETKQLTRSGSAFRFAPNWSPDSKHIAFADKAGNTWLHTIEAGTTTKVDHDPAGRPVGTSWSHDARWLAYQRTLDDSPMSALHVYDVKTGERHQLTRGMFADTQPTFDRHGDYLYFASQRRFAPTYSDIDTTFVYRQGEVLLALPLRADVASPFLPTSDEETWGEEPAQEAEGSDAKTGEGKKDGSQPEAKAQSDPLSGTWTGSFEGPSPPLPAPNLPFTMDLVLAADGSVTGTIAAGGEGIAISSASFDRGTSTFRFAVVDPDGISWKGEAVVSGDSMKGSAEGSLGGQTLSITISATREGGSEGGKKSGSKSSSKRPKKRDEVTIDFEGIERRALQLPITAGSFGQLGVNDQGELLFVRTQSSGSEEAGIKVFDLYDEKNRKERDVAKAARGFALTADGKKMLIARGSTATIQNASAGASGKPVPTQGMTKRYDPRVEWKQMLVDAWRLQRDYFYVANLHGVDWDAILKQYLAMVPDCASREDLDYVIGEMIAELNVGHAYVRGRSEDGDTPPRRTVGLLGCDFELHEGAYRIATIQEGGAWDADARGPLSQPGVDVHEGDFLLAVNGVPLDVAQDPWAAFQGLAGQVVELTVSAKPSLDDEARRVLVEPLSSEGSLRYRAWVEANRQHVFEASNGRVGYIYVPNTGHQGQNELFRQFYGQSGMDALIIDERWNGGGQIPTRFIELLNRPVTNYWATRDGRNWTWPPDSHQGPKCMLINGRAGSGGDAFPAYFRRAGLGKLIGRRTWGGLVGISGNPALVDGGGVTVPTFGYFETDGTWGIEGHGVDPDIEVIDDPALMQDGADPQLDAAIAHMLEELEKHPYRAPQRPADPKRSGMGIPLSDR